MKRKTNTNTYSPAFQAYLKNSFQPAQTWAQSDEGSAWIQENIPSLAGLIKEHYNTSFFAVYCIELNEKTLYVGESIRTVRRLVVHAYNIAHNPELFGLEAVVDLGMNRITVELLEKNIFNKKLREATELHYIKLLKPILQQPDGKTDLCIPRSKRPAAIAPYLIS